MLTASICRLCASPNLSELDAEMNIHFPGLRSLDRPPIFAFSKLLVSLDCGLTESIMSEAELRQLRECAPRVVRISLVIWAVTVRCCKLVTIQSAADKPLAL